ncbi:MAG: STAS domain-containing protein [Chlorobi bacterium]|nr:STAS domain-containing protein [Chlorobiota bacterium]
MLELIEEQKGKITGILQDTNRLTAANAPGIKDNLTETLKKKGVQLTLNLKNIKFIDSTGIGVLISALKTAKQTGSNFKLCAVQDEVMSLLKLMKLDQIFDINQSESDC